MPKLLKKELLPLGSVVVLKEGTKEVMIFARKKRIEEDTKIYDYVACLYPEGYIPYGQSYFFDHAKIDKVLHMGFVNEAEKYYKIELLTDMD